MPPTEIECIQRRKDGTHVTLEKTPYHFRPKGVNIYGPHVAEVTNPRHIGKFLSAPEAYKIAGDDDGEVVTAGPAPTIDPSDMLEQAFTIHPRLTKAQIAEIIAYAKDGKPHPLTIPSPSDPIQTDNPPAPNKQFADLPEPERGTALPPAQGLQGPGETGGDNDKADGDEGPQNDPAGDKTGDSGLDAKTDAELAALYAEKEGRKPPPNIKRETLLAALKPE